MNLLNIAKFIRSPIITKYFVVLYLSSEKLYKITAIKLQKKKFF